MVAICYASNKIFQMLNELSEFRTSCPVLKWSEHYLAYLVNSIIGTSRFSVRSCDEDAKSSEGVMFYFNTWDMSWLYHIVKQFYTFVPTLCIWRRQYRMFVCLQSLGTKGTLHLLPSLQNNEPVHRSLKQVVNLSCLVWHQKNTTTQQFQRFIFV